MSKACPFVKFLLRMSNVCHTSVIAVLLPMYAQTFPHVSPYPPLGTRLAREVSIRGLFVGCSSTVWLRQFMATLLYLSASFFVSFVAMPGVWCVLDNTHEISMASTTLFSLAPDQVLTSIHQLQATVYGNYRCYCTSVTVAMFPVCDEDQCVLIRSSTHWLLPCAFTLIYYNYPSNGAGMSHMPASGFLPQDLYRSTWEVPCFFFPNV